MQNSVKWVGKGSRDLHLKFWNSLRISLTVGARNVKFGMQMHHQRYWRNKCKIRSKGVGYVSRDLLLKFWDPSISRERLEPETSHMACIFITRVTTEAYAILGQRVSGRGQLRDLLFKFWDSLYIAETVGARNVKFGMQIHHQGY